MVLQCEKLHFLLNSGPEVIKLFPCSSQLSMKFFLLINVKMPTIVGILTFMSRKNSILNLPEPEKGWISWYFHTYEHLKFHAQLSWAWKKFYNLEARPGSHVRFPTLQGPVFKNLTASLFNILLNFQRLISQICQYFLLEKMWEAFAVASLIFSNKKY